jgi:hypothetical protein
MKKYIKYDSIKNNFQHSWKIPYDILLNTIEWREYREEILKRDKKTCTKCNKIQSEKIGKWYVKQFTKEELETVNIPDPPIDVFGDGSIILESIPTELVRTLEDKPTILHVHHLHYVFGHLPWDYKMESLVSVCHKCHFDIHQRVVIPVYTDITMSSKVKLTPCNRCFGTGFLEQFNYHHDGICFRCDGRKFEEYI